MHYAGYSKDEILKIARELAGEMINVDVEEREKGVVISVKLKWSEKLVPNGETSVGIFKDDYTSETNQESEVKKIRSSTQRGRTNCQRICCRFDRLAN